MGDEGIAKSSEAAFDPSGPSAPSGAARSVFLSYASHDADTAQSVCQFLESHGVSCWLAPRDVKPGAPYADAIVAAINEAKAVVLMLSGSAVASDHVAREVERAASKHKTIIAFRIDSAALNPGLEYFLSNSQWIDVPALGMPAGLAKLKEAVGQGPTNVADPGVPPKPTGKAKRFAMAAALVVGVGVAVALGIHFWSPKASVQAPAVAAISDRSIAVLPFVDMSEKKDQEYFADGMSEEVLDLLAKIPGLTVIGRTSSFQFKGMNQDLRAIGTKLGAAYVVEGSVRRTQDRVRVTAQLVDARDGAHRWSETYDRPAGDALQVQDEIAVSLARALEVGVVADSPSPMRRLKNDQAYDAYLRGLYASERNDVDGVTAAQAYFRQALDIDPTYTDAAVQLAFAYYSQANQGMVPAGIGYEQARRAVESALKLDPECGLAHGILGAIHSDYDRDWAAADREFKRARTLAPHNGDVLWLSAQLPLALGQDAAARQLYKEALAYDPLNSPPYMMLAFVEQRLGHWSEAEAVDRRLIEIAPTYDFGHVNLAADLLMLGDREAALAEVKREGNPIGRAEGLAFVYHAMGRKDESDAALRELITEGAHNCPFCVAEVYGSRGQRTEALQWLGRACAEKDPSLFLIKGDPWRKDLEGDPRYKAFLKKMNLPE
jgi:TolB-like protein